MQDAHKWIHTHYSAGTEIRMNEIVASVYDVSDLNDIVGAAPWLGEVNQRRFEQ